MNRLGLALCFAFLGLAPAQAQPVDNPTPATAGAYNLSPPTCTNGKFCWAQVDINGNLKTTAIAPTFTASVDTEGTKITCSASQANIVPAASATDIFTITGSATKTIRVTRISFSGQATATSNVITDIVKRSTANTAGTSAAATAVPHDSTDACTATVLSYSVNPTTGTPVGSVRSEQIVITNGATPVGDSIGVWDFTTRNSKGIVLRGVAQVLAINLRGITYAGAVVAADVEWTEE